MSALFSLFINPLDHAFTCNINQWLSRKTCGCIAGGDDAEDCHLLYSECHKQDAMQRASTSNFNLKQPVQFPFNQLHNSTKVFGIIGKINIIFINYKQFTQFVTFYPFIILVIQF
jgi:hypothetical protein